MAFVRTQVAALPVFAFVVQLNIAWVTPGGIYYPQGAGVLAAQNQYIAENRGVAALNLDNITNSGTLSHYGFGQQLQAGTQFAPSVDAYY